MIARCLRVGFATLTCLGWVMGCETNVVGVSTCREIEYARCDAGVQCGQVDDLEACRRFVRDNCLHGLELERTPSDVDVETCLETLAAAGECAEKQGSDTRPFACNNQVTSATSADEVCDIVTEPQRAVECQFLEATEDPEDLPGPDAGVDAGSSE